MKKTLLLISSSRFLKKDFIPILGKPLRDYKIAQVTTASKGKGVRSLEYLDNTRNALREQGCYFEDLDIDGKKEDELRSILKNFDAVMVNGGSTYYLLKSIQESGFDKVIKELLPQGFLYIGASAGAYVCCPTIEMATWKHQDKYDHSGLTDFTGMNLIPFLMTVHYTPEYEKILKEKIPTASCPVKILTDEQALLVKDDAVTLLGGEEVLLF